MNLGKTLIATVAAVAACAVAATPAGANTGKRTLSTAVRISFNDAVLGTSKAELIAQRDHSADVIRFFSHGHPWMLGERHPSCSSVPWTRTCVVARSELAAHRWLAGVASTRLKTLYPPPAPPAPVVGHWALWNCITNGAYTGAPHEGNGYNGSYTGPLGMTTPWAGHYPTGSDWVHTPIATVYSYAEQEYAAHHYSRAWLSGQWPNTSPPCFRYAA